MGSEVAYKVRLIASGLGGSWLLRAPYYYLVPPPPSPLA